MKKMNSLLKAERSTTGNDFGIQPSIAFVIKFNIHFDASLWCRNGY